MMALSRSFLGLRPAAVISPAFGVFRQLSLVKIKWGGFCPSNKLSTGSASGWAMWDAASVGPIARKTTRIGAESVLLMTKPEINTLSRCPDHAASREVGNAANLARDLKSR